jgi:dipeptide/tripeptide permease
MTQQVWFMLPALWVFGIGEMMASPKVTEYVGSIADDTKKALYMGFAYWPLFLGNIFAGVISGSVYQNLSDKHSLTIRWAEAKGLKIDPTLSHSEYFNRVAEQSNQSPKQLT